MPLQVGSFGSVKGKRWFKQTKYRLSMMTYSWDDRTTTVQRLQPPRNVYILYRLILYMLFKTGLHAVAQSIDPGPIQTCFDWIGSEAWAWSLCYYTFTALGLP